jgi:hypothetical protein
MEAAVRQIARSRGESTGWLSPVTAAKTFFALPLTQVVYAAALISVLGLRTVHWRGIAYRIDGPWGIRLIEYRPYASAGASTDENASL